MTVYNTPGVTILPGCATLLQEPTSTEGKLLQFPSASEELYDSQFLSRFSVTILGLGISKCTLEGFRFQEFLHANWAKEALPLAQALILFAL
jgi:hypothetical protein